MFLVLTKTKKITWVIFCGILFAPFLVERLFVAPITLTREPLYLWGAIHWVYCYIAYGAACFFYSKWRRKEGCRIILKPSRQELKWLCISVLMGIAVKRSFEIIAVYLFSNTIIHISTPMIYRELIFYLSDDSLLLGVGGFAMQYIYYVFEFALIALMVDCAQKASVRFGWSQKFPWGGIFIALTWGLIHPFGIILPALRGEAVYSIYTALQCLTIGLAYLLPGNKPLYSFLVIMAWYWL